MEKTIVFDNNEGGCNSGMMGLIASLCQNRGLDPNMVAAMMNNNRGNGWGDGNSFIWVIFLFFLMGWGRNGWGGFGGNGQGEGNFLAGQLANDTGRDLLMSAIQGNGTAISQLASTLNCDIAAVQGSLNQLQQAICNVGNQVGMSSQAVINAINQGNCQIATQISSCCCDLRDAITRGNYENQIANLNQTNQLTGAINFVNSSVERGFASTSYETSSQTCELKQEIGALKQYVGDQFCAIKSREDQREIQNLRDQVQAYQLAASQQLQTANIVSQLQPVPRPSYIVPNPYCNCGGYPYGYNNGCCGNNNGCCGNSGCGC